MTEKNRCVYQPVLHVAGTSRVAESNPRGESQKIGEQVTAGEGGHRCQCLYRHRIHLPLPTPLQL